MSSFETVSDRTHRGAERRGFQGLPPSVARHAVTLGQATDIPRGRGEAGGKRREALARFRDDLADLQGGDPGRAHSNRLGGRPADQGIPADLRSDLEFWIDVVSHPDVRHVLWGLEPEVIGQLLGEPNIAMRFEHGGFIFVPSDSFGRVYELHTLFKPEGWGKPVFHAARQAFDDMFERCDLIVTHETRHPQSRPPKTFRFVPLGDFVTTTHGEARLWMLTRQAWETSPARNIRCL